MTLKEISLQGSKNRDGLNRITGHPNSLKPTSIMQADELMQLMETDKNSNK